MGLMYYRFVIYDDLCYKWKEHLHLIFADDLTGEKIRHILHFPIFGQFGSVNWIVLQIWYFSWLKKVFPPCCSGKKNSFESLPTKGSRNKGFNSLSENWYNGHHDQTMSTIPPKNGPIEMELLKLDPKRKILRTTEMDSDISSFLVKVVVSFFLKIFIIP